MALQNFHPRFKSGRPLHPSLMTHAKGAHRSAKGAEMGLSYVRLRASDGKPTFAPDTAKVARRGANREGRPHYCANHFLNRPLEATD
jgi:hypothetical protein